jgi:hypothetical protein
VPRNKKAYMDNHIVRMKKIPYSLKLKVKAWLSGPKMALKNSIFTLAKIVATFNKLCYPMCIPLCLSLKY